MKIRLVIPRAVKDAVLKEFNHRCAVCGKDRPHLHHIDEDPSNNDPLNLIPLCPNCHVTDQHDASNAIPLAKLRFFRCYKHRHILMPQFNPVFRRMEFLSRITEADDAASLKERADELIALVRNLAMGPFYGGQLEKRLAPEVAADPYLVVVGYPRDPVAEARQEKQRREWESKYREQLRRNTPDVERLVVEMLDYQTWAKQASA